MTKIVRLGITQFEGLEALSFSPDDTLNMIEGRNGAGKTSVLEAIRVAFTNRGQRSALVHDEEDYGMIIFELSDGLTGEREVNAEGRTAGPVTLYQDGNYITSAQKFLNKLGLGFGFNPLEFIDLRTDKQTKMLLEVTPINITLPELLVLSGGKRLDNVDYRAHPLQVLTAIAEHLEEDRRAAGRDARDAEGMTETLLESVPEDFDAEEVRKFDLARVADQLAQVEKLQYKSHLNFGLQEALKKELLAHEVRIKAIRTAMEQYDVDELVTQESLAALPSPEELRAGISVYREQQAVLVAIESAHESQERAEGYRSLYGDLQEAVTLVRAKPGELLMEVDLPVEGLGIGNTGEVTINDLPISELSTGEKLKVAVDIAIATLGDLQVVLVDGLETLDKDNSDFLLSRLTKAGVQAFVTRIADTELTVLTEYGEDLLDDVSTSNLITREPKQLSDEDVDDLVEDKDLPWGLLYGKDN